MNLEMRKKMKVDYFIQELIEILNEAQVEVESYILEYFSTSALFPVILAAFVSSCRSRI